MFYYVKYRPDYVILPHSVSVFAHI